MLALSNIRIEFWKPITNSKKQKYRLTLIGHGSVGKYVPCRERGFHTLIKPCYSSTSVLIVVAFRRDEDAPLPLRVEVTGTDELADVEDVELPLEDFCCPLDALDDLVVVLLPDIRGSGIVTYFCVPPSLWSCICPDCSRFNSTSCGKVLSADAG